MPDYDAFGREIGHDPLVTLREATVEPAPAPAVEAAPTAPVTAPEPVLAPPVQAPPEPVFAPPVAAPPQFVRPPRRRHRGLAALLVLIAVVGGLGWAASVVVVTVQDEIDAVIGAPDRPAPTGLQGASLIRRVNFAKALTTLRDSGIGRPLLLRVAPDRINATLVDTSGRMHHVQVDFDGELRELSSNPSTGQATTAFDRIDRAAPERLVRAGGERAGVAPGRIDYVLHSAGPPISWGAYFKGGTTVLGGAHGRPQRVLAP